jgi:hypothetical protein
MGGMLGWTGGLNGQGYGMVRTGGRNKRRAHRVIWEKYKGSIGEGEGVTPQVREPAVREPGAS